VWDVSCRDRGRKEKYDEGFVEYMAGDIVVQSPYELGSADLRVVSSNLLLKCLLKIRSTY